jgi:two-component system, chemotaxis family, protein-glutamate methylesterase/glutaminase
MMNQQRFGQIEAIVIGASAGGLDALRIILTGLPDNYRLPIIVVLHIPEDRESRLVELFTHFVDLPVKEAMDKDHIAAGTLYFACAGYHLSIESDHCFSLSCELPVLYSRPSINILMESAALAYGPALAGILLTGASEDGAEGMARIAEYGGLTIVQDPAEAQMAIMPKAALKYIQPDMILRLNEIHHLLLRLENKECK